jgi:hypothetical protein
MNPRRFLPEDADATEIQPGRWRVQLVDGQPGFHMDLHHEGAHCWLCFSVALQHPDGEAGLQSLWLERLLDLQERFPAIKVAVPTGPPAGPVQLCAEAPLAAGEGAAHAWPRLLLEQYAAALVEASDGVERRVAAPCQPLEEEELAMLGELGCPVEVDESGKARLRPAVGGRSVSLNVTRSGQWLALDLQLSGGALRQLEEPCRKALAVFLPAVSGSVRLARAGWSGSAMDGGRTLCLSAAVPSVAGLAGLRHGISAVATAAQRYETEIEDLASEVLLAHAFGAIRGGAAFASSGNLEP